MSYPTPMDVAEVEDREAMTDPFADELAKCSVLYTQNLVVEREALIAELATAKARLAEAERVCAQWCEWNEGLRNQLAEANQLLSSGCTAYDENRLGKWMQDVAVFLSRNAVSASGVQK